MSCRPTLFAIAAALALPLAACTPSDGAAVTTCSTGIAQFGVKNPVRECELRVRRFKGHASATFDADAPPFYRHYEADADFQVESGRVLVRVTGSHEPVEFVVEPGRPWKGRIVARLRRQDRRFSIAMEPQGEAAGLQASIRHRNVMRSMLAPTEVRPGG